MAKATKRSTRATRNPRASTGHPSRYSTAVRQQRAAASATVTNEGSVAVVDTHPTDYMKDSTTVDWQGDYGYVFRDLLTLTIVSIVLFAAIIGAGFFL